MPTMPNPWTESAVAHPATVVEAAAPSSTPGTVGAAADHRFVLDEEAFLNDIEPLPAFLVAPSQPYLRAVELVPMLRVLAGLHP